MQLTKRELDGVLVISTEESRIDAAVAIQFKDEMRRHCEFAPDRIVLDLAAVDFIDSSGLGAVVASLKQMPTGKTLELCRLSPTVEKVFRLTRMDTVFTIHASLPVDLENKHAS